MSEKATYTHGYHASVLRSHSSRTAANSAGYLLPHLKPHHRILDLGCGPGTITVDIAATSLSASAGGHITGLETAEAAEGGVLQQATDLAAARGVSDRASFVAGDGNGMPFADDTFDVVVCHQVLQHVGDPVGVLREMTRVAKTGGGIVAARETDTKGFIWFPESDALDRWHETYTKTARALGGEPNAGRRLKTWAQQAGLDTASAVFSASCWTYATEEEVKWWSGLWAERTVKSSFAKGATEKGTATPEQLERIKETWENWGQQPNASFIVPSGEMICYKAK